ncbi:two-component regulator propeller domain-containing protein [Aureispira sp. CCB-E]|uniref:hybrid sensor histidine kinase/response regulator transcription factor n=1 Tax=Aureispira sp. CCB-E TaxID=3051121 RepID=UPI0028693903|nr:two-component regulator propeller domain-containing protein [Aureispira sp. CCB-E]WMX13970.1 response regulator [Aureispira sp. CCB-E]
MHPIKLHLFYYIFLLLFLNGFAAKGQSYLVQTEQLSIEDGLSNRFVRSILQDTKGFMWFATKNGLNRYDGYTFDVFTEKNTNLQSSFIDKIFEDADSNLWIGHAVNDGATERFSAIDIMDINTFEIKPLEKHLADELPCQIQDIYKIYSISENKNLYITTQKGAIYIYKGNKKFELYYKHPKASTIRAFFWGTLYNWVVCENTLMALDKQGQVVYQKDIKIDALYRCSFMGEESPYTIRLETNDKFHAYDNYYWNVKKDSLVINKPFDFLGKTIPMEVNAGFEHRPKTNCLVYQDRKSVCIFAPNQKVIYSQSFFKGRRFVRTVYVDRQENVWIGVLAQGLVKVSYQKNRFEPYLVDTSARSVIELYQDSVLLLNSYGGQYAYHLFTQEKKLLDTLAYLDAQKSQDGRFIWLSSPGLHVKRLERMPPFKEQFFFYKKKDQNKKEQQTGMRLSAAWSIYEDEKGRVWVGTVNGLSYIQQGEDSISVFDNYGDYPELAGAIVNSLHGNKHGVWLGTSQGLYLMNLKMEVIQRYSKEMKAPYKLPYNHIYHIHEDKKGILWLSTKGGGVIRYHIKTGTFKQFTTENGLSHNVVNAILEDDYGYFWMSSDYGLMRLNPKNDIINTYLTEDGILHTEFNRKSAYKASTGKLYFGGLSGIMGLDPADFLEEKLQDVPLHLVQFQYFNGKEGALIDATEEVVKQGKIVLDYTDRFFTVELALLDYKASNKRQYAYKIEGLEKDWNFTTNNSIRVNSLAAGNYTLLVKGEGSNGLWSTEPLKIPIIVKQPFYLTWQFLLFIAILLFVVVLLYSRWRVQRLYRVKMHLEQEVSKRTQKIEQQANELRELDNVKSRFFANISHELRTPLTLMLGPIGAILEKHYGEKFEDIEQVLELVKRNGIQLQGLIEEILILSKLEAKSVEIEENELQLIPFLKRLFFAFEAQANLQGLDWYFNSAISEDLYVVLDASKIEKILNNLLSNALKHTPRGGKVELKVTNKWMDNKALMLLIEVIDSGTGIHPDDLSHLFDRFYQSKQKEAIVQGGTGIGLALTKELVQLLKGRIEVHSEWTKGASFLVTIPSTKVEHPVQEWGSEPEKEASVPIVTSTISKSTTTILIVEDNNDMRSFLADILQEYQIITAENGRIGWDILSKQAHQIDLILSDVMMPEMDGFELLQKVKSHTEWQQLPMIMLTARATEQDKLFALRIGVDDYLQKPFSRQELLIRIQNLLQNYAQRKAWQLEAAKEEETSPKLSVNDSKVGGDKWMENLEAIAKREVGNTQFTITSLAYDLNLSERQLRRKIKTKTGLTPNQYFRVVKLEKAREYLENRHYETVSEIAYKIGFSNVHYFSKIYQEQYGKKPSEYLKH